MLTSIVWISFVCSRRRSVSIETFCFTSHLIIIIYFHTTESILKQKTRMSLRLHPETDNGVVWLCSAEFRFTLHLRLRTQEKTAYIKLMSPHQAISCLMYQIFINPRFFFWMVFLDIRAVFSKGFENDFYSVKKSGIGPSWNRIKTFGSMKWIYSPYQIPPL